MITLLYAQVKQELYEVFSNKRYMLSLGVQLGLIFAILPVFATFLSGGSLSILTPSFNEFIPLGVVDNSLDSGLLRASLAENEKIDLLILDSFNADLFDSGALAAVLLIPAGYDEGAGGVLELELLIDGENIKSDAVYDAVNPSIESVSAQLTRRRNEGSELGLSNLITVRKELMKPVFSEGTGEQRFSSFFISYLIPLMLFFPIFTVGSIILDSVVGERERKTVESLIVSPIQRYEIVVSRFLAASFFVGLQIILWMLVFTLYGFPIQNKLAIFFLVLLIDSAIISTAIILAYYSRTVKEANILLMLLYTNVFIALIVSLSLNYFNTPYISTPFTLISDLVAGERPGLLLWAGLLLGYTFLVLLVNIRLVERDDIVFGPRPGLLALTGDLAFWLYSQGRMGGIYLTAVFGVFALAYSTAVEIAVAVFIIFSFGFTNLLVPLFALIEEAVKPAGLYLLASKKSLSPREAVVLGMLSGAMFFLFESLFFAVATYYFFPEKLVTILQLRLSTTLVIHMVSSGIVGYGVTDRKKFPLFLLIATVIHTLFNIVTTGGVL